MEEEREALDERDSFYHCLVNAAHQFNVRRDGKHYILAGYPWFKCRARDTFISMPGLTLSIGEREQYEKYMDAAAEAIRQFINKEPVTVPIYEIEQPDSLLWATWCLQQYRKNVSAQDFQERYGELLKDIMEYVRGGHHSNLFVQTDATAL